MKKISFIIFPWFPHIHSITRFFIKYIMTSVTFAIYFIIFFPDSESITNSLFKITFIITTIWPNILTISLWKTIYILTLIPITIVKNFEALTMFQTISKFTLIFITLKYFKIKYQSLFDAFHNLMVVLPTKTLDNII